MTQIFRISSSWFLTRNFLGYEYVCSLISFESLSTHESKSQRSVILFILSLSPALKRLEEYLAVARVRGKPRRISRKQRGKHRRPFAMPRKIVGPRLRATALRSEAEDLMTSRRRRHATSDLHLNYPWWCFKRVLKCIANCFRLLKSKSNFTSTFLALFFCSCQVLFCCMWRRWTVLTLNRISQKYATQTSLIFELRWNHLRRA